MFELLVQIMIKTVGYDPTSPNFNFKKGWDCRYLLARYVNSLLWTKLMLRAHIVMFNPVIIFFISKQTIKCVDTMILFVKNT